MGPSSKERPRRQAPRAADPWMSVPDAALALGIHQQTVKTRIAAGLLVAQVVGGRIFVRRDSVAALAAERA